MGRFNHGSMHSSRVQLIERNRRNLERWRGKVPQSILPFEEERRALLQEGRLRSSLIPGLSSHGKQLTHLPFIGLNGQNAVDISSVDVATSSRSLMQIWWIAADLYMNIECSSTLGLVWYYCTLLKST